MDGYIKKILEAEHLGFFDHIEMTCRNYKSYDKIDKIINRRDYRVCFYIEYEAIGDINTDYWTRTEMLSPYSIVISDNLTDGKECDVYRYREVYMLIKKHSKKYKLNQEILLTMDRVDKFLSVKASVYDHHNKMYRIKKTFLDKKYKEVDELKFGDDVSRIVDLERVRDYIKSTIRERYPYINKVNKYILDYFACIWLHRGNTRMVKWHGVDIRDLDVYNINFNLDKIL